MDIYGNMLVSTIATKLVCFLIKLSRHVSHGERINLLILKVKVTMDIYGNTLVNMIVTKLLCAS